ncbi:E3 ubiquitin-protein ligase FANCL-like [Daphnia pulex]|uniref:E3 ubiquitin-protein ligase FANCL-like n=1 Tax=Daphnia pulex TaxID=6669 RepID=UPI001EDE7F6E|nr:E3 ubiquitin-protein ligase FANCL-like [Daphnia pulex]
MELRETSTPNAQYSYSILPLNDQQTIFDCLLVINGKDYVLHLLLPNYPSHKGCTVNVSWELRSIMTSKSKGFNQHLLENCCSVAEFVEKLVLLIKDHTTDSCIIDKDKLRAVDYSNILDEIDKIGWEKLSSVNHDFTEIRLKMYDSLNREHILNVKFNNDLPEFSTEFPRIINFEWHESTSTLIEMYNIFCEETEHYQDFWETMDELDSRCWVLEPENPSRRDTYRKISIAPNVSLKIEVDPNHPRIFPSITWLGSETAVFVFREKILDRVETWNSDFPITTNLERLLEISLPSKQTCEQTAESHEVTCCICYSERLNGEVPSRTCDNSHCGQSFHIYCLYEWLRSLRETIRKQGNKVFGACPYCDQPISCNPPGP